MPEESLAVPPKADAGAKRVADALVEAIEARGGTVKLKTRVERIIVDSGRAIGVALADGRRVMAQLTTDNANPAARGNI